MGLTTDMYTLVRHLQTGYKLTLLDQDPLLKLRFTKVYMSFIVFSLKDRLLVLIRPASTNAVLIPYQRGCSCAYPLSVTSIF